MTVADLSLGDRTPAGTRSALGSRMAARAIRTLLWLLLLGAVAGAWRVVMPVPLGGSSFYAVVSGVSMLPRYHTGDLVVVKAESRYRVGEVAGYRDPELKGLVVLHRIVAERRGRYTFKGDNNKFADPYQPTRSQIVGAEWIHLPQAGLLVEYLRTPIVAAVILGALWILTVSPARPSRHVRRRHRHHV